MALSLRDMTPGTIVDHWYKKNDDDTWEQRPLIRRGVVVEVDGNGHDQCARLMVKFSVDPKVKPEEVAPAELVKVLPANSRKARRILKRVLGQSDDVGAEFVARQAPVVPRLDNPFREMMKAPSAIVLPKEEDAEEGEEA